MSTIREYELEQQVIDLLERCRVAEYERDKLKLELELKQQQQNKVDTICALD